MSKQHPLPHPLQSSGITISTRKQEHRGHFYPKIHRLVTNMYGHLLQKDEHFHLPSEFLITITLACETPFVSDEILTRIVHEHLNEKKEVS